MTKDLLICALASLNMIIFSFIGFHYEAFQKLNSYSAQAQQSINFDQVFFRLQQEFSPENLHAAADPIPDIVSEVISSELTFLSIPKLNLRTPVNFPSHLGEITEHLQMGTLGLTPFISPQLPGQNIIFGHSSDYPWKNNEFGTIFTLLPQLQQGDEITITRGEKQHLYRVQKSLITDNKLTGIIGSTQSHELILSTCYPIGFFNKRYNVVATPIEYNGEAGS
jgi:LPXTG-site transpeptidase (sortase) family protein